MHSFSRFFRDAFGLEFYVRKLAKHGVRLVSITQELGDDPAQVMMRQVIALFDEYQSKENAKHVLRSMKENARQGYWNGARPPFGFKAVEVERRGSRIKKRLAIDRRGRDRAADLPPVPRRRQWLRADGRQGHRRVAQRAWLSHARRRDVGPWAGPRPAEPSRVCRAACRFNRIGGAQPSAQERSRSRCSPEVPAIIEPHIFDQVQSLLKARNPRVTPPRIVTGPILLTGLAVCATCHGAMTLRTGTSKTGKVHRYYACSSCARQGKTACKGRSIRMDKLDTLVTDHLADRLLNPERLTAMLASLASRRAAKAAAVDERLATLEKEAHEANDRLRRLYKLVEDGVAESGRHPQGPHHRTEGRSGPRTGCAGASQVRDHGRPSISARSLVERFGHTMREKLTTGEVPFRKAYLGSIVDRVEVDDREIRIVGRKDVLEQAVLANGGPVPGVRSFVRKWRSLRESNSSFQIENLPCAMRNQAVF